MILTGRADLAHICRAAERLHRRQQSASIILHTNNCVQRELTDPYACKATSVGSAAPDRSVVVPATAGVATQQHKPQHRPLTPAVCQTDNFTRPVALQQPAQCCSSRSSTMLAPNLKQGCQVHWGQAQRIGCQNRAYAAAGLLAGRTAVMPFQRSLVSSKPGSTAVPANHPAQLPGSSSSIARRSVRTAAASPGGNGIGDGLPVSPDAANLKAFIAAAPQLLGSNPSVWFWVLGPVILGTLTGATGSFTGGYTWYESLRKPWYTPPGPVFGIAWTALYILMGLAAYRVYEKVGWPSWALQVYLSQLALNLLWYAIFFDAKKPRAAQLENAVFFILVLYTTFLFFEVDATAGYLMLPYVAWVAFANLLNLSIAKKN